MGAGKTTVGQILARRLGGTFVDLDHVVGEQEGRSIPEIFRDSGETHFRQVETECLRVLLRNAPSETVLALGGGAFVQGQNAEIIRQSKVPTIFLDASPQVLYSRCAPLAG